MVPKLRQSVTQNNFVVPVTFVDGDHRLTDRQTIDRDAQKEPEHIRYSNPYPKSGIGARAGVYPNSRYVYKSKIMFRKKLLDHRKYLLCFSMRNQLFEFMLFTIAGVKRDANRF